MQPKTDFAIIPDRAAIETVGRDIRFFPSTQSSPQTLAADDIDAWNRDGYLGPLDVFDNETVVDIRSYFDGLLAEAFAAGRDSYSISSAHLKHARVWDLLTDQRIVRYVCALLGEDVVGWGSHFFCKKPGDGKSVDGYRPFHR